MATHQRNKEHTMEWKDIVPWNWGRKSVPVRRVGRPGRGLGLMNFPEDMGNMLESFFGDDFWGPVSSRFATGFSPSVDVSETEKEYLVSVEVPGMTQENLNLTIDQDHLIIEGEKRDESERTEGKIHYKESSFGKFQRVLPLPQFVDVDNIQAIAHRIGCKNRNLSGLI